MPFRVRCSCGATLKVRDDLAGKTGQCPKCGDSIPLVERRAAPSPIAVAAAEERTSWDFLDDEDSASTASTPPVPEQTNSKLTPCPDCGKLVSKRASQCPNCGCPISTGETSASDPPVQSVRRPDVVRYDADLDLFTGTTVLMVKLAMRAVQQLGWKIETANEALGIVSFETGMSWGSWSGVSCSLNMEEVSPNAFRVVGTGKQNLRGGQLIALDFGEAQGKARRVIQVMQELAS